MASRESRGRNRGCSRSDASESEAAYLERFGLFTSGERRQLKSPDFGSVAIRWDDDDDDEPARRQAVGEYHAAFQSWEIAASSRLRSVSGKPLKILAIQHQKT